MENANVEAQPVFSHVEPVLAVADVSETILYWHDVLGFPVKWTWGDPPEHGAVSWQKVFIQFSKNPKLAALSKGNYVWIRVQRLETLYNFHQRKNAEIVASLENKPWGMAAYTLRDINGYFLHFAGLVEERSKSAAALPPTIKITGRYPTAQEYQRLQSVINGSSATVADDVKTKKILDAAIFAVVAENTVNNEVIGYALLTGDDASFYYVKDVMVHPHWQGRRVGTAMMHALNYWLDKHGADNALVGLIARETLEPFYQQFGFASTFSMLRYIHRDESDKRL